MVRTVEFHAPFLIHVLLRLRVFLHTDNRVLNLPYAINFLTDSALFVLISVRSIFNLYLDNPYDFSLHITWAIPCEGQPDTFFKNLFSGLSNLIF